MTTTITFYGGAGSVTGANFLLDTGSQKILFDCGTHKREHICDPANHAPFPYDVSKINALVVTHAHQDHIGRVPKLLKEGFKGRIYSTPATKDLSAIMFEDALNVMQHEAEKSHCAPIFEKGDCIAALDLWDTHEYHEPFLVGDISIEFFDAGHILGSAMARCTRGKRTIIFSGDLGNSPEPLLHDTESPAGANYLVMESVYGDRIHEHREARTEMLRQSIDEARTKEGTLLIPSFSIERTQIILYEIHRMIEEGKLTPIPIFLDAPLAIRVTDVFRKYRSILNISAQEDFLKGDIFSFPGLTVVQKYDKDFAHAGDPKVIIAGAGMSSGGRIRSHEKKYLPNARASVLFTGYQAAGSLGRRIQDGEKNILIDGERVHVKAHISSLTGYSGHKDRDGLVNFAEEAGPTLEKVFVVMGEPKASGFLAQRIKDFLGLHTVVPQQGDTQVIDF